MCVCLPFRIRLEFVLESLVHASLPDIPVTRKSSLRKEDSSLKTEDSLLHRIRSSQKEDEIQTWNNTSASALSENERSP